MSEAWPDTYDEGYIHQFQCHVPRRGFWKIKKRRWKYGAGQAGSSGGCLKKRGSWDPLLTMHGKDKVQNYGSFISTRQKIIKIMWLIEKKNCSWKNNDALNLWKKNTIWIISQEIVGLQSDQKIVVNFIWWTTLMASSG